MNQTQKDALMHAMRHGMAEDADLELVLVDDIRVIEPIVDSWIEDARNYFLKWALHTNDCNVGGLPVNAMQCSCGLLEAIYARRPNLFTTLHKNEKA